MIIPFDTQCHCISSIGCYLREFCHVSSLYLSTALKFPQQTPNGSFQASELTTA